MAVAAGIEVAVDRLDGEHVAAALPPRSRVSGVSIFGWRFRFWRDSPLRLRDVWLFGVHLALTIGSTYAASTARGVTIGRVRCERMV